MKRLFTFLLFIGFTIGLQAQSTAVFSKVTASWCPNCGTWGWGLMEAMKAEYADGNQAIVLGVHYSGDLKTPTAEWFAQNLKAQGQPQFFIDNAKLSVGSSNWQSQLGSFQDMIDNSAPKSSAQFNFVNAFVNNDGEIEANIEFEPITEASDNDLYFAVYVFENNVSNFQAGLGSNSEHPNVLRRALGSNPEGELYASAGSTTTSLGETANFTLAVQNNWNQEQLGLLAIVWEQTTDGFIINYAQAVQNIGLLSSDENILDAENFTVVNNTTSIDIKAHDDVTYNCTLLDAQGKMIQSSNLNRETSIPTDQLTSGIYILNIQNKGKYFSQKLFVK